MKNCTVANTDAEGWGGINVDKNGKLTIEGTLNYTGVATDKPVIWSDTSTSGTVKGYEKVGLEKQDGRGSTQAQTWYVVKA